MYPLGDSALILELWLCSAVSKEFFAADATPLLFDSSSLISLSNALICVFVSSNSPLIPLIPAHLGFVSFVSPLRTSPINLSIEHSVSASPTKIELDWESP